MPAHWQPKIIGVINEFHVKVVTLLGEFVWHHHDTEDELFLVVKGRLLMRFRDGDVWVNEGECIIVPHGVEHCPVAPEEVHVVLIEPNTTLNTGTSRNERTADAQMDLKAPRAPPQADLDRGPVPDLIEDRT